MKYVKNSSVKLGNNFEEGFIGMKKSVPISGRFVNYIFKLDGIYLLTNNSSSGVISTTAYVGTFTIAISSRTSTKFP